MVRSGAIVFAGAVITQTGTLSGAVADDWTVWKQPETRPVVVYVAPVGRLAPPWRMDGTWRADWKGAWKKACWLVRTGDITGRHYVAPEMASGKVTCDDNCNCRF